MGIFISGVIFDSLFRSNKFYYKNSILLKVFFIIDKKSKSQKIIIIFNKKCRNSFFLKTPTQHINLIYSNLVFFTFMYYQLFTFNHTDRIFFFVFIFYLQIVRFLDLTSFLDPFLLLL